VRRYFFEIAKLRAIRVLFNHEKNTITNLDCHISNTYKRNKTIYDYNVNMLRTKNVWSAILGGADAILIYLMMLYHKDNEFGDRIARNQLTYSQNESY
jgi:methylmalonyl-CoA mutase